MSKKTAAVFSALLAAVSFPVAVNTPNLIPAQVSMFAVWLFLVPLGIALRNAPPGQSFRYGYLFGLLANGGIFFWVIVAMQKYGGLSVWVSLSIYLLMVLHLALFPAAGFWAAARLRGRAPFWLSAALVFTLLESIHTYFPFEGFPWTAPAYGLYGAIHLIQSADIVGVTGLNFLIFGVNFLIVESAAGKKQPRAGIAAATLLMAASFIYGAVRIKNILNEPARGEPVRVTLLQGNIPQNLKWDPAEARRIISVYRELSRKAAAEKPDLIVWPEAAVPYTVAADIAALPFLGGVSGGADFIVGGIAAEKNGDKVNFLNSAFVTGPDGKIRMRYDKQHLVPFGEYVPLSDILPMHYIVPAVAGNFVHGTGEELARTGGTDYALLICYEILFPEMAADLVRKGAGFFVNITNDAWFDRTSGPYQHARFARFRAIETRRPVVRAANTGVTAWFDAAGGIHEPTALFTEASVTAEIAPRSDFTFYVRHPWWVPAGVCLLLAAAVCGGFKRYV